MIDRFSGHPYAQSGGLTEDQGVRNQLYWQVIHFDSYPFPRTLPFGSHLAIELSGDAGVSSIELGQLAPRPLSAGLSIDKLRDAYPQLYMRNVEEAIQDWQAISEPTS
jgi:hypothetical protein